MYTARNLVTACKKRGFAITNKKVLSRYIGDGILQQIYYGDNEHIWIGINSMYSDLPEWQVWRNIPFTLYLPKHLHGIAVDRNTETESSYREEDISLLINGGLDILDTITTQEKLIQFANLIESQNTNKIPMHYNRHLYGAYIQCDMMDVLMNEVCYDYVDIVSSFRRSKENTALLVNGQHEQFVAKYLDLDREVSTLYELCSALQLSDNEFLRQYAQRNLERNLEQIRNRYIPIIE